jgi:thymidylate synthase (FAD)
MTQIKVSFIDYMGNDLSVVNAARVSFNKRSNWEYKESGDAILSSRDKKLILYLAEHKHMSPFGHAFATFCVKAPIFVARQLVKHKFLRWNEVSRRYIDDPPEFYEPKVWRNKSTNKKQGSEGAHPMLVDTQDGDGEPYTFDFMAWKFGCESDALSLYNMMIENGVAPEQARMVLPQNVMTEWYWSGSLDAFADMCNLRCYSDAQAETKEVADMIDEQMKLLFPVSWPALRK